MLSYVQIWILIYREFSGRVVMNAGYNGAKGSGWIPRRAVVTAISRLL